MAILSIIQSNEQAVILKYIDANDNQDIYKWCYNLKLAWMYCPAVWRIHVILDASDASGNMT